MKKSTVAVTGFVVIGGAAGFYLWGQDPPRYYDRMVVDGRYIQSVSGDGSTLTLGQSASGGPIEGVDMTCPDDVVDYKVQTHLLSGKLYVSCAVPPVPEPGPTPIPSPEPTPEPTATPSHEPTPTPSPGVCEPPCVGHEVCVAGLCVLPPQPTPTPSGPPTPVPTPSATPTPGPTPPVGTCVGEGPCLPDDPGGLERSGDGRFARGSGGPTGQGRGRRIEVTSALGDTSPGTIRAAYASINGPSKVVLSSVLDGKIIKFPIGFLLKWDKPYTTLDCSETNARFMPGDGKPKSQVISVGATHDVIFKGCGGIGHFNETKPQMPANDMSLFAIANFIGVPYSWDDEWATTPPLLRGTARRILFDQIGCSNIQDDCVVVYDGVTDTSILRSFIRRGWHPTTAGSADFRPPGDPKERRRITYAFNVWFRNGARQIRAWRGIRDWRFVRNIVAEWVEYVAPDVQPPHALKPISPNAGLWLEDDWGGENDLAYVKNNLGLPGTDNRDSGCIVGGGPRCEACGSCAPGSSYAQCNPKMAATRWFFSGNEWGGAKDCHTNPPANPNSTPPTAAYDGSMFRKAGEPAVPQLDEARSWARVLAEVGPPKRLPAEQADLDWLAARLPQ